MLFTDNHKTLKICVIETICANKFLDNSSPEEKNYYLQKEMFDFGMILLGVMTHKNLLKEAVYMASREVTEIIDSIKTSNIAHIKNLIENCTIKVNANAYLPTMEEVDFILGISRTAHLEYIRMVLILNSRYSSHNITLN